MKTELTCFGCRQKLRVPAIGKGKIICPHCSYNFTIENGRTISAKPTEQIRKSVNSEDRRQLIFIGLFVLTCIVFGFLKDPIVEWYKNRDKNTTSPYIEITSDKLHLYNLHYTVGLTGINEVNTNISEFDELIWDKLKNSSGKFSIVRHDKFKNNYGTIENIVQDFGKIDLNELNKYQSLEDFRKDGGLFRLINRN